uniref:Uncharacterized protein n=1 Tax=Rhizophora mucronata TaxID=61149 RepID=A0A2P2N204_RHIMU
MHVTYFKLFYTHHFRIQIPDYILNANKL